jgi:hypothetical protein
MVYVAVWLAKKNLDKYAEALRKQAVEEYGEKAQGDYSYQEGEIEDGSSCVRDIDVEDDSISISTQFYVGKDVLGNTYVRLTFDDIGWERLLAIKNAVDKKLLKVAEAIQSLTK